MERVSCISAITSNNIVVGVVCKDNAGVMSVFRPEKKLSIDDFRGNQRKVLFNEDFVINKDCYEIVMQTFLSIGFDIIAAEGCIECS